MMLWEHNEREEGYTHSLGTEEESREPEKTAEVEGA
jgi:hypothetical protein